MRIDKKNVLHWVASTEDTFKPRKEVSKNERPHQVNEQFLAYALDFIKALVKENDKLSDEIFNIKETFQHAVNSKNKKGGQQVPYHGDFAGIAPSTVKEMESWIKRWEIILGEENAKLDN